MRVRQLPSLAAVVPEADEHTSVQTDRSRFRREGVFRWSIWLVGWFSGGGVETRGILNFLYISMRQNENFAAYLPH